MRDGWPPRPLRGFPVPGLMPRLSVAAGETFRLLLPRRLAQRGRLIAYDEVAGNPALAERWAGVPTG